MVYVSGGPDCSIKFDQNLSIGSRTDGQELPHTHVLFMKFVFLTQIESLTFFIKYFQKKSLLLS